MNNVPKVANDNLIEQQSAETNSRSSSGDGDSNIVFRQSQWETRPPKYLEDYETWFDKYRNDVKKGPKGEVVS